MNATWTDHLANPAPVELWEDLPPPEHEATPAVTGADIKSPLAKQDEGNVTGAPPTSKRMQCLSCNHFFTHRDGGQWADLLCAKCEDGQTDVFHLEGGEDE